MTKPFHQHLRAAALGRRTALVGLLAGVSLLGAPAASAAEEPAADAVTTTVFRPVADTFVDVRRPHTAFGTRPRLRTAAVRKRTYLRFELAGVGEIQSATLFLRPAGGRKGPFVVRSTRPGRWSERTTTFRTAPRVRPGTPRARGHARKGWTAVDVTRLVRRSGSVGFVVIPRSARDRLAFRSRESGAAAQLRVLAKAQKGPQKGPKAPLPPPPPPPDEPPPPPPPSPEEPPPPPPARVYGIANGSPITGNRNATDRARELDGIKQLGGTAVRFDASWSSIEPTRGSFNWSKLDAAVADSRSRGLDVLITITYAPAWANGGYTDNKYAPNTAAHRQAFADYAARVALRYRPQGVRFFEGWNEPNHAGFWKPAPNPAEYADLQRRMNLAIKAAVPDAIVLGGSLAGLAGGSHISPAKFLQGMYDNGAAGTFDALATHPYIENNQAIWWESWGWDGPNGRGSWFGSNESVLAILHRNEPGKKIWFTETGDTKLSTTSTAAVGKILSKLREYQDAGWGGPIYWYAYRDLDSYSVVDSGFNPRPAWFELQKEYAG